MDKLNKKIRELSGIRGSVKIGFCSVSRYDDGTPLAYVAYLNEYCGHNPARPFMKRTARRNMKKWVNGLKYSIKGGGLNKHSVLTAYKKLGIVAVGDVKRTIESWSPGGNSPATVERKRRRGQSGKGTKAINPDKVLIDTGKMIASVAYEVRGQVIV